MATTLFSEVTGVELARVLRTSFGQAVTIVGAGLVSHSGSRRSAAPSVRSRPANCAALAPSAVADRAVGICHKRADIR